MVGCTLVIGNKNYSSWSLRPWLLLKQADIAFDEIRVALSQADTASNLAQHSPSGRVPVLLHGDRRIWDSLAICEYVSEQFMAGAGWPEDVAARALARSVCAEMHSGFAALRAQWPMNCRARMKLPVSGALADDVARVDAIWRDCRSRHAAGGRWLFGRFSIADCMFAPMALRFNSYGPDLSESAAEYLAFALGNRHLQEWIAAGRVESEIIPADEVKRDG